MTTLEDILGKATTIKGAEPFFIRDKNSTIGTLMLHGFTDSPKTMSGLAALLYEKSNNKIASLAPLLPGHGTIVEDLKNVRKEQWYEESVESFKKLQERYDSIFLIGFSLGANLCYLLAEEFREESKIKGIISISGAFELQTKLKAGTETLSLFKNYLKKTDKEEAEKKKNPYWVGYNSYPLPATKELIRLGNDAIRVAEKLHVPCLFFQGTQDGLLKKKCAERMYNRLKNVKEKEIVMFEAKHLLITYPKTLPAIAEKTYEFIHKTLCPIS